jgi:hypothetical protein
MICFLRNRNSFGPFEMLAVAQQAAEAEGLSLDFRLGSLAENKNSLGV